MINRTEQITTTFTGIAGADLAYKNRFAKISSDKVVYCGLGDRSIGIIGLTADSGGTVPVKLGKVLLVEVGTGGVTEMTEVQSDANGKAIAKTTGVATGVALHSAAAGEFAQILI